MKSKSFALRSSTPLVLCIAPLLLITACAAATPPVAEAPSAIGASTPPASEAQAREPTGGSIAISDEIRAACGIPDEDAFRRRGGGGRDLFAFDSASMESADIKPLDAVARCFATGPLAGRSMHLVGHADPRGASEYNVALGQRRADSVDEYVGRRGVSASRIVTTSRGAMDATGQDEAGWAHDRRVDVQLGG